MNTTTIDKVLSSHPVSRKYYMGCFPADRIPKCQKFPCAAVLNLDTANKRGSHWVAMYAPSGGQVYYFDSYGDAPTDLLEKYLEQYKKITHNKKGYQSPFSKVS